VVERAGSLPLVVGLVEMLREEEEGKTGIVFLFIEREGKRGRKEV